jgi:hypothetical protein
MKQQQQQQQQQQNIQKLEPFEFDHETMSFFIDQQILIN